MYNLLYCVVYLEYLRGQMAECRQGLYSTWLPTHSLPVAGQLRVLMLVPSPQVTEQELQVDQPVQSASTVNRRGILLWEPYQVAIEHWAARLLIIYSKLFKDKRFTAISFSAAQLVAWLTISSMDIYIFDKSWKSRFVTHTKNIYIKWSTWSSEWRYSTGIR